MNQYYDMNDSPLSELLRQAIIKPHNQLMTFSDSSWQDFPDTDKSTGVYILFFQGWPMHHDTHVPGPVSQSSAET